MSWALPTSLPEDIKGAGVCPLWPDGAITSPYEDETLPLLYADFEIFDEYYEALASRHPRIKGPLTDVHERNKHARAAHAEGDWYTCLGSLAECVRLRAALFGPADWQATAAARHLSLTAIAFAAQTSMRAAALPPRMKKDRNATLGDALKLARRAEDLAASPLAGAPPLRGFLRACAATGLADTMRLRGRPKAAAAAARAAARHWRRSSAPSNLDATLFLNARASAGLCLCAKWRDAQEELEALLVAEEAYQRELEEEMDPLQRMNSMHAGPVEPWRKWERYADAPVRFHVLLSHPERHHPVYREPEDSDDDEDGEEEEWHPKPSICGLVPVRDAAVLVSRYNAALCCAVRRRDLDRAGEHLREALDICNNNKHAIGDGKNIKVDNGRVHPWRQAIKRLQAHLDKMLNPTPGGFAPVLAEPAPAAVLAGWEASRLLIAARGTTSVRALKRLLRDHRPRREQEWLDEAQGRAEQMSFELESCVRNNELPHLRALGYKAGGLTVPAQRRLRAEVEKEGSEWRGPPIPEMPPPPGASPSGVVGRGGLPRGRAAF